MQDFLRYKSAVRSVKHNQMEVMQELRLTQSFLMHPDANRNANFVFQGLSDELGRLALNSGE